VGIFDWFKRGSRKAAESPESAFRVTFDEKEILCTRPDGESERVEWSDLKGVVLRNTDDGPFAPDVFWLLLGENGGCVVPQGATGSDLLLERLQKLPDFDNQAVIASATCADNQDFLCWEKADS
jgi:hypothetical protein